MKGGGISQRRRPRPCEACGDSGQMERSDQANKELEEGWWEARQTEAQRWAGAGRGVRDRFEEATTVTDRCVPHTRNGVTPEMQWRPGQEPTVPRKVWSPCLPAGCPVALQPPQIERVGFQWPEWAALPKFKSSSTPST